MRKSFFVFVFAAVLIPSPANGVTSGIGESAGDAQFTARYLYELPPRSGSGGGGASQGDGGGTPDPNRMCVVEFPDRWGEMKRWTAPCEAIIHDTPTVFAPFEDVEADPAVEAAAIAEEYIRNLSMPEPNPEMSAPEGISGATHSLDLNIPDAQTFRTETGEFGELRATAHGRFTINWGDGTTSTHTSAGGPWPDGDIWHTWTKSGNYDIAVQADWVLDWSLGSYSGTLVGLGTDATLEDWSVIEAQALITR